LELKGFKSHEEMNEYMSLGGDKDTNSQNVFYGINFKNKEWATGMGMGQSTKNYRLFAQVKSLFLPPLVSSSLLPVDVLSHFKAGCCTTI